MNEAVYQQIDALQKEIAEKHKKIIELRSKLKHEPVKDYALKGPQGEEVLLSSLFDHRDELLIVHNMGKRCTYCTLWADGLNGVTLPLNDRVPFVVVSPDSPSVQKEFAENRGWKFQMLSAEETSFIADMGFEPKPGSYYPGVSSFVRKEGNIYRTAYDYFGPGDPYCSVWHLFNLLPKRENNWHPRYVYSV